MKKVKAAFAALVAVIMLITAVPFASFAEDGCDKHAHASEVISSLFGDANMDGIVSISDALIIARAILENQTLDSHCDIDQDGTISFIDALLTLRCAMNIDEWVYDGDDDMCVSGSYDSVDVYAITDLTVDTASMTATATVSAPENCALVVRFIEEDLYFSSSYHENKAYIDNGKTYAAHVVPAGTDMDGISAQVNKALPEFFVAEAMLIDGEGNALCDPYSSIEHTERYREFSSKTIYDFGDEFTVLNFDDSIDNNFGVLSTDVVMLSANTVERDLEANTYMITELSGTVEAGDKVYLVDAEGNDYLFMVKDLSVDELTTITAASSDDEEFGYLISDFYRFIKVDMTYEAEIGEADDDETGANIQEVSDSASFELNLLPIKFETDHFSASGEVKGKLGVSISVEYDIVIFGRDYVHFEFSYTAGLNAKISIAVKTADPTHPKTQKELNLGKVVIPIGMTGLDAFASIDALIELSASVGLELGGEIKQESGFIYDSKDGKQKIDSKESTWQLDARGTIEITFGPKPSVGVEFLGGLLAGKLECFIGAKAEAEAVVPIANGGSQRHACHLCASGELKFVMDVDAKLEYSITEHISDTIVDWKIVSLEAKLFDFFASLFSPTNSLYGGRFHFGLGSCENIEYLTHFEAFDASGQSAACNITLRRSDNGAYVGRVNAGDSMYLQSGTYVASANINGDACEQTFTVRSSEKTVTLTAVHVESRISGRVCDAASSDPICGAAVEVYDYDTCIASVETDASGSYSFTLEPGTYSVIITSDGYVPAVQYVKLRHGENKYLSSMLMARHSDDSIMGGIFGTIKDGATGMNLEGVSVHISRGWDNSDITQTYVAIEKTDSNGQYAYRKWSLFGVDFGIEAGNYTLTISKPGYVTTAFNVTVVGGMDLEFNSTLTPIGEDDVYRIVLTWGASPRDLDSHLNGTYNGARDHIYYSRKNGNGAALDVDDTTSYGPETITIPYLGVYTGNVMYSVHDYTNRSSSSSAALSDSGATVKVYRGSELVETFNVPTGIAGTVWNVFYFDASGNIVPVNSFEFISQPGNVCGRDS